MRKNVGIVILFVVLSAIIASSAGAATPQDLTATWHGFWIALEGWVYEADMVLAVDGGNNVTGSIQWTLRQSPRLNEQDKIGKTGVEYVKGTFLPDAGAVRMEGTLLDDPNHILGVDKYRLILSDDATVLGGITWHHGPWTGQILLHRR
jgi:hypothetical protein